MLISKRSWVIVCLCCVCVCCETMFASLLGQVQVWLPLPETLSASVCECVCVSPYVDAFKKKTMSFCVSLLCMCVFWGPPLSIC